MSDRAPNELVYSCARIFLDCLETCMHPDHKRTLHRVLALISGLRVDLQRFPWRADYQVGLHPKQQ